MYCTLHTVVHFTCALVVTLKLVRLGCKYVCMCVYICMYVYICTVCVYVCTYLLLFRGSLGNSGTMEGPLKTIQEDSGV